MHTVATAMQLPHLQVLCHHSLCARDAEHTVHEGEGGGVPEMAHNASSHYLLSGGAGAKLGRAH